MRNAEEVKERIYDLTREMIGKTGSRAYGLRQQLAALEWVLGDE